MRMRSGALFLACATALLAGSCGAEDESGACTGTMNGAYFRLEIANFIIDSSIDVRVNGRFIGTVTRAENQPGSSLIEGKVKRLGEFPVCDKMVIDARGNNGGYTTKICSKPAYLSPQCSGGDNNFCWETLSIVPSIPCDQCVPFQPAQPSCPCPYGFGPGTAWEPC